MRRIVYFRVFNHFEAGETDIAGYELAEFKLDCNESYMLLPLTFDEAARA